MLQKYARVKFMEILLTLSLNILIPLLPLSILSLIVLTQEYAITPFNSTIQSILIANKINKAATILFPMRHQPLHL